MSEQPSPIRRLRKHLGMTLSEFGERVGVSSLGHMSQIERGVPCSLEVALAIEAVGRDVGFPIDASELNDGVRRARASLPQLAGVALGTSA